MQYFFFFKENKLILFTDFRKRSSNTLTERKETKNGSKFSQATIIGFTLIYINNKIHHTLT